jgi:hypothetical protein
MNLERDDIQSWSADWKAVEAEPEISLETIRRGFRRYTWSAVGSWLVGGTMLVGTTALAWVKGEPTTIVAAAFVWAIIVAAATFDLRYRPGTWKLEGESTRDYLELARRQLEVRLRGIRFGWGILAVETLFFALWIPWVVGGRPGPHYEALLESYGFLAVFVGVFSIALVVVRRRAERELERLNSVRKKVAEVDLAA